MITSGNGTKEREILCSFFADPVSEIKKLKAKNEEVNLFL
jgi:hypothetical protein